MWREFITGVLSGVLAISLILACTCIVGSGVLFLIIYVKTPLQLLCVGLGIAFISLGIIGILMRD